MVNLPLEVVSIVLSAIGGLTMAWPNLFGRLPEESVSMGAIWEGGEAKAELKHELAESRKFARIGFPIIMLSVLLQILAVFGG